MQGDTRHPDPNGVRRDGAGNEPEDAMAPEDLAALYAAGAMSKDEQERFEAQLIENPSYLQALRSYDAATAALIECVVPVVPHPDLRAGLLSRVAGDSAANASASKQRPRIRRASEDAWRPMPMPGISMRILHIDRAARRFSGLFRMEVGAVYPSHVHEQPEEILVLEGDLEFGNVNFGGYSLEAGDYIRLEAGSAHSEARTKLGCVCLITAELPESLVA
jgi:quercetin dioxygenase-like cupin family protein